MSNLIQSMILEVRPRLQSCNVFIIPEKNLSISCTSFKVNVKSDSIEFIYQNSATEVTEHIKLSKISLLPKTLTSLNIEQKKISFRVATNCSQAGSFKTEVLNFKEDKFKISNNFQYDQCLKTINILQCRNCTNELSVPVSFTRVLPLPSDNCNPDDWFCHKPHGSQSSSLEPSASDCFYKIDSFKINTDILRKSSLYLDKVVFCKRCLAWLGVQHSLNSVFLWYCTILRKSSEYFQSNLELKDEHLFFFKVSVLKTINETMSFVCKILIECKINVDRTEYLFLWILDKKLQVLLFEGGGGDRKASDAIHLNDYFAAKLLFKYIKNETTEIKCWQSDVHVQSLTIALPMFQSGIKYLYKNAELMSDFSELDNNFIISYLILNEN